MGGIVDVKKGSERCNTSTAALHMLWITAACLGTESLDSVLLCVLVYSWYNVI